MNSEKRERLLVSQTRHISPVQRLERIVLAMHT